MYLQGVFLDFLFYIYFLLFPAKLIYRAAKDPLSGDISSKQKPVLFVVQHTTMAVDLFALMGFIYLNYGRLPRGLGDRSTSNGRRTIYIFNNLCHLLPPLPHRPLLLVHFKVPIWSHMLTFFGAIVGDRQGCAELMKQGEPILVFPGGRKEVFRSKSDHGSYSLHWQDRKGLSYYSTMKFKSLSLIIII